MPNKCIFSYNYIYSKYTVDNSFNTNAETECTMNTLINKSVVTEHPLTYINSPYNKSGVNLLNMSDIISTITPINVNVDKINTPTSINSTACSDNKERDNKIKVQSYGKEISGDNNKYKQNYKDNFNSNNRFNKIIVKKDAINKNNVRPEYLSNYRPKFKGMQK